MTDKLTDNEIVKALECCADYKNTKCKGCPLEESCVDNNICELALDLIVRLQAENERLENSLAISKKETKRYATGYKTAKAEAYKECIEKVKEKIKNISKLEINGQVCYLIGTAFFDNLLKEKVGEDNAK